MRPQRPERTLAWMKDGTERLLADLAGLPDEALAAPTALPGWTRRHLLAHLAANAGALRNLVYWARTSEERRMYASQQQRDADIAAGAARPADELRAWVESSAAELAADLDALPGPAWEATVITAQGVTRAAAEIPWMRVREVYVHAVARRAAGRRSRWPPATPAGGGRSRVPAPRFRSPRRSPLSPRG